MTKCIQLTNRLRQSRFFQDSLWAVMGNGIGYALLLLSGILIARLLGKDLYGEYGFVKTTMFHFAAFSTLGLGYTSTKFVAEYMTKDATKLTSIVHASINITAVTSCIIALLLFIFAHPLSDFLNAPSLVMPFRFLGFIVIMRALSTTQFGIMAGFGDFKKIAYANAISGVFMFSICIPLTYYYSLRGSLIALALSQILTVVFNWIFIHRYQRKLSNQVREKYVWKITMFSIPVALQELTFSLSKWIGILIITKFSSMGELGIFTASEMWGSVIFIIPNFLSNVILSHLSSCTDDIQKQRRNVRMMILVNLACTLVPFLLVYAFSSFIVSFYGDSFTGMVPVLRIIIFTTMFQCCSNVLSSEIIALNSTWPLFTIRAIRDALNVILGYTLISLHNGEKAAIDYAITTLVCMIVFTLMLYLYYKRSIAKLQKGYCHDK